MHTTLAPKYHALDNEASNELKSYFDSIHVAYQCFPEGQHRANPAERAIQTFKAHFISGLCTVDASFPLTEWDELNDASELALNLVRASNRNPHVSAWEDVRGKFDFTRTPLAPVLNWCLK